MLSIQYLKLDFALIKHTDPALCLLYYGECLQMFFLYLSYCANLGFENDTKVIILTISIANSLRIFCFFLILYKNKIINTFERCGCCDRAIQSGVFLSSKYHISSFTVRLCVEPTSSIIAIYSKYIT